MPDKKGSASKIKMRSVDELFGIGGEDGSHAREHIKDIDMRWYNKVVTPNRK